MHSGWPARARALLLAACSALSACGLPPLDQRTSSRALAPESAVGTPLGRALAPQIAAHAGLSGIYALSDPLEAFATRALLMRAAQRTL
ncbi:MAG: phospholipase D family protein, partial [Comamonas sp.]